MRITIVLLVALLISGAVDARPRPILKPTPVYLIHNPGKDGDIWAVGIGERYKVDINRRFRTHSQAEAEKAIALMLETSSGYRFAGKVEI
jgi:hypothetical protein